MPQINFCQYAEKNNAIWFGAGRYTPGDSFTAPGLDGCFGMICVPRQAGRQWFMGHSKIDPSHLELESYFWDFWQKNGYQGGNDFTIIWKFIPKGDNFMQLAESIRKYFITRSARVPGCTQAFPYYLGRSGTLALTTDATGAHTIITDQATELRLGLDQFRYQHRQVETTQYREAKPPSVHEVRKLAFVKKNAMTNNRNQEAIDARTAKGSDKCNICEKVFYVNKAAFGGLIKAGLINTQHRCKNCNMIICDACSKWVTNTVSDKSNYFSDLVGSAFKKRICLKCFNDYLAIKPYTWPIRPTPL